LDALFVANVPDLSTWGTIRGSNIDTPRKYLFRLLDISIQACTNNYATIVHEISRCIASARLDSLHLQVWENAVSGTTKMLPNQRTVISRAIARGICAAGTVAPTAVPVSNDNNFKGHIVEVIHFCLRTYLSRAGTAHPLIFEPPRPKASPSTPGIDLLEIGGANGHYYFTVWECKGTDGLVNRVLGDAGIQLCHTEGTAMQGFMEAYRSLQTNPLLARDNGLSLFVNNMPRLFYATLPTDAKRVGGVFGAPAGPPVSLSSFVTAVKSTT
jgi:hypothetical protein